VSEHWPRRNLPGKRRERGTACGYGVVGPPTLLPMTEDPAGVTCRRCRKAGLLDKPPAPPAPDAEAELAALITATAGEDFADRRPFAVMLARRILDAGWRKAVP
jgi:hypothetical protein